MTRAAVSDVVEVVAATYGDLRLVERALLHASASARDDGVVAGCGRGGLLYLGTYAAPWITGRIEAAFPFDRTAPRLRSPTCWTDSAARPTRSRSGLTETSTGAYTPIPS